MIGRVRSWVKIKKLPLASMNVSEIKWEESTSLQRRCLHSSAEGLQIMVIRMPPMFKYDFISDECDGLISFFVAKGTLVLETLKDDMSVESFTLTCGELKIIERRVPRMTRTRDGDCVYIEHIENGHRPEARRHHRKPG